MKAKALAGILGVDGVLALVWAGVLGLFVDWRLAWTIAFGSFVYAAIVLVLLYQFAEFQAARGAAERADDLATDGGQRGRS